MAFKGLPVERSELQPAARVSTAVVGTVVPDYSGSAATPNVARRDDVNSSSTQAYACENTLEGLRKAYFGVSNTRARKLCMQLRQSIVRPAGNR